MDNEARIAYLKSLPREEAARILHAEGVALQMKQYQKAEVVSGLAMLVYGSDKVFDRSVQSLADSYLIAYLAQPEATRNVNTALAHCTYPDHTDAQTAGILMAKMSTARVANTAAQLNVTTNQVETALTLGIAELLDAGQLMNLSIISMALFVGTVATKRLQGKQD